MALVYSVADTPSGHLEISLYVEYGTGTIYCYQAEISPVSCGNDDDSDLAMMLNKVDVRLHIPENDTEFLNIAESIYQNPTLLLIELDGDTIFYGYVENMSLNVNTLQKVIKFGAFDAAQILKDIDPTTNPLSYSLPELISLEQLITDALFTTNTKITFGGIYTTVEGKVEVDSVLYEGILFENFFVFNTLYYDTDCFYTSLLTMLKDLLLNYNLVGYVNLYREFKAVPRSHSAIPVTAIQKQDIREMSDYSFIEPIDAMSAKLWTGVTPQTTPANWVDIAYGDPDSENIENLRFAQPGGQWPVSPGGINSVWLKVPDLGTIEPIDASVESFRLKRLDDTYTDYKYLYALVYESAYETISLTRKKIKVVLSGIREGYYWSLPFFPNDVFRSGKIEWDIMNNQTILYLRKIAED